MGPIFFIWIRFGWDIAILPKVAKKGHFFWILRKMVQTSNFFIFFIFIVFYDLNYAYELIFMKKIFYWSEKIFYFFSISFNFSKKWYFCFKSFSTRKIGPNRPIFQLNSPNTVSSKVKFLLCHLIFISKDIEFFHF